MRLQQIQLLCADSDHSNNIMTREEIECDKGYFLIAFVLKQHLF